MKKKKKNKLPELKKELEEYERQGVELWLEGFKSSPKEITKAHRIAEQGSYMRDYENNETGEISKIGFDYVEN